MMLDIGFRFTAFVAAAAEAGSFCGSSISGSARRSGDSRSITSSKSVAKSLREALEAEVNRTKFNELWR